MSRSRRRTPICGYTSAKSEHVWKKRASRSLRHWAKQVLAASLNDTRFSGKRWERLNPWDGDKDGKHWFGQRYPRLLRK